MDSAEYRPLPHRENDNCFGCSPNNSSGLQLRFFTNGEKVVSWLRVPKHLSGWDQIVHGGVIATMLDEVMGWTALHLLKKMTLTKAIAVKFLKPVHVDEDIRIEGRPFGVKGDRKALMQGFLYNKDNALCAKATGNFALFTVEAMRERGVVDEKILQSVERIISE
jgi:acyl-coenzyme A thioesterase PaaI-like protein